MNERDLCLQSPSLPSPVTAWERPNTGQIWLPFLSSDTQLPATLRIQLLLEAHDSTWASCINQFYVARALHNDNIWPSLASLVIQLSLSYRHAAWESIHLISLLHTLNGCPWCSPTILSDCRVFSIYGSQEMFGAFCLFVCFCFSGKGEKTKQTKQRENPTLQMQRRSWTISLNSYNQSIW